MSQGREVHIHYQAVAHELRLRQSSMSPLERMYFSLDTFRDFRPQGEFDDRGGTPAPILPITAPETQHTFTSPERFYLVTEALDLMDTVMRKGTQIEYNRSPMPIPSFAKRMESVIGMQKGAIYIGLLSRQAQYRALIATILKYPYTAPAFKAVLGVAGHDGISTAAFNLEYMAKSAVTLLTGNQGINKLNSAISTTLRLLPQSEAMTTEIFRLLQRDGKLPLDFLREHAQQQPDAFPIIKYIAAFLKESGQEGFDTLKMIHFGGVDLLAIPKYALRTHDLITSPDETSKRIGLSHVKLAMNLEKEYQNRDDNFWGVNPQRGILMPHTNHYEVVCLGRSIAKRVHEFGAAAFYTYAENQVLTGAANPCMRMVMGAQGDVDSAALDEFIDRLGTLAVYDGNKKPLERLANQALRTMKIPHDDVLQGVMLSFI